MRGIEMVPRARSNLYRLRLISPKSPCHSRECLGRQHEKNRNKGRSRGAYSTRAARSARVMRHGHLPLGLEGQRQAL